MKLRLVQIAAVAAGVAASAGFAGDGAASSAAGARIFPPDIKVVGVVMPASILAKDTFDRGIEMLKSTGVRVKIARRIRFDKVAPLEDRVADFEDAWMDPEVDLVLCARGGTGSENVITRLDWARLRTRPDQRVLGFSNITMILNAMLRERAGHPFSGPSLGALLKSSGDTKEWTARAIAGDPQPAAQLRPLRAGSFSGLPCGGHIALVRLGINMKWNADAAGRVVFLERNNSASAPRIRRELEDIVASGYLDKAAGVIFGDVTPGAVEPEGKKGGGARKLSGAELRAARAEVESAKRDFAAKVKCPVYDGYAYGHVPVSHAIDFRRRVSVDENGVMTWE